jgi:stage IV sporulation protein FB
VGQTMIIGEIRGIKLKLSNFLPLLFFIYLLLGIWQKALMVFAIIIIHEVGHVLIALLWGIRVHTIELFPLGGVARMESTCPGNLGKEIILYLVGPMVNFLLGGVWGLALYFNLGSKEILLFLIKVSLIMGGFNLIPAWPFDGGRIFRAVLSRFIGFFYAAKYVSLIGQIWAAGFFFYGILAMVKSPVNFHWWIIAGYLFYLNRKEKNMAFLNYMRYLTRKDKEIEAGGFLPAVVLVSQGGVTLRKIIERLVPHRYHLVYVLDTEGNYLGLITEKTILNLTLKGSMYITLEEVFERKDKE